MARKTLINTAGDMAWLFSTHLKKRSKRFKSAVIYGNEDCPSRVELFRKKEPTIHDRPIVYTSGRSCKLRRKR